MNVAVLGAGSIAHTVAHTLAQMPEVTCHAVAARSLARAEAFAREFGFKRAYGSYEELMRDPEVELVYVATPHSHHYAHAKLCLTHGKSVLCEKAFTVNAAQARELIRLARESGVFLAEAIWTRYLPMRKTLEDVLASGAIGTAKMLTANLSYAIDFRPRVTEPETAGGALLDVGVYPLNFALMVFGGDIASVTSTAVLTQSGVDGANSFTLTYKDGRMAVLNSGIVARGDARGVVYGTKGRLEVCPVTNPQWLDVFDDEGARTAHYAAPPQISGYEYEFLQCIAAIKAGKIECEAMPHAETLRVMELMDTMRGDWGLVYPME